MSEKGERPFGQDPFADEYADLGVPTLLKRTLGLQRRHHGLHVGDSGRIEPILAIHREVDAATSYQEFVFRRVHDSEMFALYPDQKTECYEEEIEDLDAIESHVAPHGRALIDLYFRIVHPSFPILHKKVYLEKYGRTHREFSPVLLAAVYILALDYWSYSPELSGSSGPAVEPLESLATKSLGYALHRPKLSTVEAGLLLLQRPSEKLWPLTAQMVAVGQDIGLHRDCSNWDIPDWEKGLRKRLAWALFMQDKWASLIHGRPSHILQADWAVQPLAEEDFPENFTDENDEDGSTEVEIGRTLFTCMVLLTQILSDILTTLYSGASEENTSCSGSVATKDVLMKAKPLQIRLKKWCASLPPCLSISHVKIRKLSSTGYLHLAYWAAEITLHRCIVRTLASCIDIELTGICQNAALIRSKSAMDFVRGLRPEHWQSFWYFASEFNFGLIGVFEALLSTTFTSQADVALSSNKLDEYAWTLKMSRRTVGFLDKSISMVSDAARGAKQHSSMRNKLANQDRTFGEQGRLRNSQCTPSRRTDSFEESPVSHVATSPTIQSDFYESLERYPYFEMGSPTERPFASHPDHFS